MLQISTPAELQGEWQIVGAGIEPMGTGVQDLQEIHRTPYVVLDKSSIRSGSELPQNVPDTEAPGRTTVMVIVGCRFRPFLECIIGGELMECVGQQFSG